MSKIRRDAADIQLRLARLDVAIAGYRALVDESLDETNAVARAHAAAERSREALTALSRLQDAVEGMVPLIDGAMLHEGNELHLRRLALVRAVLATSGSASYTNESWYYSSSPVAVHRQDGRTFVVARAGDSHYPNPDDDPAELLQVSVIEGSY